MRSHHTSTSSIHTCTVQIWEQLGSIRELQSRVRCICISKLQSPHRCLAMYTFERSPTGASEHCDNVATFCLLQREAAAASCTFARRECLWISCRAHIVCVWHTSRKRSTIRQSTSPSSAVLLRFIKTWRDPVALILVKENKWPCSSR